MPNDADRFLAQLAAQLLTAEIGRVGSDLSRWCSPKGIEPVLLDLIEDAVEVAAELLEQCEQHRCDRHEQQRAEAERRAEQARANRVHRALDRGPTP